jgi:hypothetical protein
MGQAFLKSLIESLQKNTCQVAHRIGYTRIELASAKPIDKASYIEESAAGRFVEVEPAQHLFVLFDSLVDRASVLFG